MARKVREDKKGRGPGRLTFDARPWPFWSDRICMEHAAAGESFTADGAVPGKCKPSLIQVMCQVSQRLAANTEFQSLGNAWQEGLH